MRILVAVSPKQLSGSVIREWSEICYQMPVGMPWMQSSHSKQIQDLTSVKFLKYFTSIRGSACTPDPNEANDVLGLFGVTITAQRRTGGEGIH